MIQGLWPLLLPPLSPWQPGQEGEGFSCDKLSRRTDTQLCVGTVVNSGSLASPPATVAHLGLEAQALFQLPPLLPSEMGMEEEPGFRQALSPLR